MMLKKRLLLAIFITLSFFNFLTAQTIHVEEDFNAGSLPTGWTNSALSGSDRWLFGNDGSSLHSGNNNIDSSNMVYFDDDNLGGTALNNTAQLSTPIFNNNSNSATFLEFDYNFRDYDLTNTNDSFYVEVFDGTNWNLVFSTSVDDCGRYVGGSGINCQNSGFPKAVIDISSYSNSTCIVRFVYDDGDDWAWYAAIDNVEVYSPEPNDIGVVSIQNPKPTSCKLSSSEFISCTIKNFSTDTINSFELIARVDSGNQQVIDTVTTQLLPLDSLHYTFTKSVDLSLSKAYHLSVHSNYTLDQNANNDTSSVIIPARSLNSLPYIEDFETTNHEWSISGTNASWERGSPVNNLINKASKGSNAFVTNLDGDYNSNEHSFLSSPCIELDTSIKKFLISFDLITGIENTYDSLYLEYSIDGGNQWQKLQASALPLNWYNFKAEQVWSGNNFFWRKYATILEITQPTLSIKFRFGFKSDLLNQFEGAGVDNFSIRKLNNKELIINSLLQPSLIPTFDCGLSDSEKIKVRLLNYGALPIDSFKLAYQVDNTTPFRVNIKNPIQVDSTYDYEFSTKANLFERKNFKIKFYIEYLGDSTTVFDTTMFVINNEYYIQKNLPFFEDFDGMKAVVDYSSSTGVRPEDSLSVDWSRIPMLDLNRSNYYTWVIAKDSADGFNGPKSDHTGNNGNYLYTLYKSTVTNNDSLAITSPCILTNSAQTKLSFWFHRNNFSKPLFIDIFHKNNWDRSIDTITNSLPASSSDPFLKHIIDLSSYASKKIKIRFRVQPPNLGYPAMAIDDFHVYDSSVVTGIEPIELGENKFTLYPNPNQGEFTLSANKELIGNEFEVYNLSGQLLRRKLLQQKSIQLNLSEFGKGIYFIRFPQLNLTKKLVVY